MEHLTDYVGILTLGVFLPLVGVALMFFIPKEEETTHKWVALLTAAATLAVGIFTLTKFDYDKAEALQFYTNRPWIDVIKSRYIMGLDGLGLPLYILSMVITLLVIVYSWDHIPHPGNAKAFLMLMLILQVGMAGTFVAQDLILFFVFFEVVLLPMYFMIGVWGGENRQYASLKFFLFTLFGSAFMLLGFLALFFRTGAQTFSIELLTDLAPQMIGSNTAKWIFAGLALGFAVKVPMFPFHTWLPDAHTQAPTQGSVILAAILLKLGTFGFVRIALPILPEAAKTFAPVIAILAVIGIIYGALGCLAQTDMKRLIAFSSVAHMGFVMLGISTLTAKGINAAMFGMVAHGLITGMLFFIAGSVKERYHTLEISRLSGLLQQMPKLGWIMGMCAMASLGLPGLAGFWGEFPAILSAYQPAEGLNVALFRTLMVISAVGTVLAAAYLLWLYQRIAFGDPTPEFGGPVSAAHGGHDTHDVHGGHNTHDTHDTHDTHGTPEGWDAADEHDHGSVLTLEDHAHGGGHADIHDIGIYEWIAWVPLLIAIIVFGVMPNLLFKIFDPAVTQTVKTITEVIGG